MNAVRNQIREALTITTPLDDTKRLAAELTLPENFLGFRGHFPGQPVLPGICMIAAVLVAVEHAVDLKLKMRQIKSAKFYSPVCPGDSINMEISLDSRSNTSAVRARLSVNSRKAAQVSLLVCLAENNSR